MPGELFSIDDDKPAKNGIVCAAENRRDGHGLTGRGQTAGQQERKGKGFHFTRWISVSILASHSFTSIKVPMIQPAETIKPAVTAERNQVGSFMEGQLAKPGLSENSKD